FLDLEGELSGGDEDQRADGAAALGAGSVEALQHGQDERRRLPGAGLGAGEDVATGKHQRDRLGLDRRGLGVALSSHSMEKLGRQPELIEGHGVMLLTWALPLERGPVRAEVWFGIERT